MIREDKLLMTMQLTGLTDLEKEKELNDWAFLARLLIQPTFFRSFYHVVEEFDLKKFQEALMVACESDTGWLVIGNADSECSFQVENQQLMIKNILAISVFEENQFLIRDYIKNKMAVHGVFAYMRAYSEFLYHNTKEIDQRLLFERPEETKKLPKMKETGGRIVIDCNQFSGYDLFYEGLCFTSCWEMYYSSYYYQVIPKPIILDVQQVEYVKELENDVVCVQLYRDPFNWRNAANQSFQAYYRDQLGFDHLAWDNGVGLLKAPFVEYAYTDQNIQSVQYQNEQMQPVAKKKASFFVTRSYDVKQQQYRERRVKGTLNAQAYFPWVDENRAQMMCYKVLDPTIAVDKGIEAYCYYIREYLEVEVEDEKYQDYLVSLRIYIPTEALAQLPLNEIRQRLSDVKFKHFRRKRGNIRFDVKKGDNHLRVEFLDYQKLEQLMTIQKA
ncbi:MULTISPECIES: hypothetical protein [unclassified Enterococcus]|uniref:hypothetical protein n=1 Tax=unclassified Enterococcus TaxID=2608891 RepID=UPI0013ECC2DF|nr:MULTISPECIES: hypothetical protein [unclassified Enterococcus]